MVWIKIIQMSKWIRNDNIKGSRFRINSRAFIISFILVSSLSLPDKNIRESLKTITIQYKRYEIKLSENRFCDTRKCWIKVQSKKGELKYYGRN